MQSSGMYVVSSSNPEESPDLVRGRRFLDVFESKYGKLPLAQHFIDIRGHQYPKDGLVSLFQDLTYIHVNFKLRGTHSLMAFFETLCDALLRLRCGDHGGLVLRQREPVNCRWMWGFQQALPLWTPNLGFMLTKSYEELGHYIHPAQDMVSSAFTSGNIGLLMELLKYGATMARPRDTFSEIHGITIVVYILLNKHPALGELQEIYYESTINHQCDDKTRRRLLVVIKCLGTLARIRLRPQAATYFKECLRRVFDSIPEPRVRSSEIVDCLTKLLRPAFGQASGSLGREWQDRIEEVGQEYESHFPESGGQVRPRSLQHLCRIRIRDEMRKTGCFVHDMWFLDAPRFIKEYLDLGCFEKSRPVMHVQMLPPDEHCRGVFFFPMVCTDCYLHESGLVLV